MNSKDIQKTSSIPSITWTALSCILASILYYFTLKHGLKTGKTSYLMLGVLIAVWIFSERNKQYSFQAKNIINGILIATAIFFLYRMAASYLTIPIWDYLCFYLFGNAGSVSSDFYNPEVFAQVYKDLNLESITHGGFVTQIVNTGFWYPPPSMFLFLPLAYFDLNTGHAIWQTLIILILCLNIFLLIKYYWKNTDPSIKNSHTFLFILASICFFPGLIGSIPIGQTTGLFLLLEILLLFNLNNYKSGIFLALLIIIKPYAAVFALYFLVEKSWKTLAAFVVTGTTILIITVLVFGHQTILNYFISSPATRMPAEIFYEDINQSLNAVLLRMHYHYLTSIPLTIFKISGYILSLVLIAITIYASKLLAKKDRSLAFLIYIPLALLIYPGTLSNYSIVLLPVVLALFSLKNFQPQPMMLLGMLVLYGIGSFSIFLFIGILWIIIAAIAFMQNSLAQNKYPGKWFYNFGLNKETI